MFLVTSSQSKNVSCFCLDMAQLRSLIGQSLCNTIYWSRVLASIGAVVEMGILSTLKRLLMESTADCSPACPAGHYLHTKIFQLSKFFGFAISFLYKFIAQ
jgi:hypothetical protein